MSDFPKLCQESFEKITACRHRQVEVRARVIAGGAVQHVRQCVRCHQKVGGAVKQASEVPPFDEANCLRIKAQLDEYSERVRNENDAQRAQGSKAWQAEYAAYLETYDWKQRRDRVMKRASGLCEGCNTNPATEVHHLTYRHVKNEFDHELVAFCSDCHDRIHGKGKYSEC